MADDEIKIAFLQKMIFNARHNERGVSLADLRDENANGVTPLLSERAGQVIRPVIQFARRFANQFLRMMRNRFCVWRAIHHKRDRGLREAEVLRQRLETDCGSLRRRAIRSW